MKIGRKSGDFDDDEELRPIIVGSSKGKKPVRPQFQEERSQFNDLDAKDIFPFPIPENPRVTGSIFGCLIITSSLIGLWATGVFSFAATPEPNFHPGSNHGGSTAPSVANTAAAVSPAAEVAVIPEDKSAGEFLAKNEAGGAGDEGGDNSNTVAVGSDGKAAAGGVGDEEEEVTKHRTAHGGGQEAAQGADDDSKDDTKDGDGAKANADDDTEDDEEKPAAKEVTEDKQGNAAGDGENGAAKEGDGDREKEASKEGEGKATAEADGEDKAAQQGDEKAAERDDEKTPGAKDGNEKPDEAEGQGAAGQASEGQAADVKAATEAVAKSEEKDNSGKDGQKAAPAELGGDKTVEAGGAAADDAVAAAASGEATGDVKPVAKANENQGGDSDLYSVVIDAGSTGSRIHVFRFGADNAIKDVAGEPQLFKANKPGLSSCANDLEKLPTLLKPLMEAAQGVVPEAARAKTPLALRATAGLRLLPGGEADEIIQAATNFLKPYGFKDAGVEIMDGADEGSLQWLSVNFLLGAVGKADGASAMSPAIDLGGGSMQVVYWIDEGTVTAMSEERKKAYSKKLQLALAPGQVNLYQHSYLGFGLMAMRAKIFEEAKATGVDGSNPCLLSTSHLTYSYNKKEFEGTGTGDAAGCKALISKVVTKPPEDSAECDAATELCMAGSWRGPKEWRSYASVVLCSYFYDRLKDVGAIAEGVFEAEVSVATFQKEAQKACALTPDAMQEENKAAGDGAVYLCMDLTYLDTLLTTGLQFSPDSTVRVKSRITLDGKIYSASWPLGVALLQLQGDGA